MNEHTGKIQVDESISLQKKKEKKGCKAPTWKRNLNMSSSNQHCIPIFCICINFFLNISMFGSCFSILHLYRYCKIKSFFLFSVSILMLSSIPNNIRHSDSLNLQQEVHFYNVSTLNQKACPELLAVFTFPKYVLYSKTLQTKLDTSCTYCCWSHPSPLASHLFQLFCA